MKTYTYVVRKEDGSVALRAGGPIKCPAGCFLVESTEFFQPSGVRYDEASRLFVKPTRAQKSARTRVINGRRKAEEDAKQSAVAKLRALVADPALRSVIECLVTLSDQDILAVLGETGAEAPAGEGLPSP